MITKIMPQHIAYCISHLKIIIPCHWDVVGVYYCMFLSDCIEVLEHIY